jgi:hypothetical protein
MSIPSKFVSRHPYFNLHPRQNRRGYGHAAAIRRENSSEKENFFYGFSVNGDEVSCRESYENANGLLAHLGNVGALLEEMLKMADLPVSKCMGHPRSSKN